MFYKEGTVENQTIFFSFSESSCNERNFLFAILTFHLTVF
jgi:hypothetical protein